MTCLQELVVTDSSGDDRDRTDNLCLARAALSQLSYVPFTHFTALYSLENQDTLTGVGVRGLEPRTSALSELRSNHLSYTPRILNVFGVGQFGVTCGKCPVIKFMLLDFPSFESRPAWTSDFSAL